VPLSKISRGFRDISLSFKRHPVTNDLVPLKNEDAIKRAVQNLVRTKIGEVFFRNDIGTRITGSLFELANEDLVDPISTEIETVITNFEPRVNLKNVDVNSRPEDNTLDIEISYNIVGLSLPIQTINFILEPTRL
jgi:phage baseplate assembly protein W|tara:strand:+ start:99 stop:503 length:405 start_codon:yes stop_codon:yes gene_type:complete